ncbi:DnaJ-like protein subfamily C member 28-like [Oopsacas minuta]|uniref:DnaJ-like protein subfamily C member 28-like n=1 Tax=Oopsacas minuta TaxID=111878 RepID=A0AAV7JCV6_9METZ|nr:DnaJ-like protein subfamily C member 28-like [Oopsacas minuta]
MLLSRYPWLHIFTYTTSYRYTRTTWNYCYIPNARIHRLSTGWSISKNLNEYKKCLEHLQISEGCSLEEAKSAYIKFARIFHPDSKGSRADSKRFSDIRNAYLTVLNYKQNQNEWTNSLKEEDWNPEFIIDHIVPQHRQYLELDGVGGRTLSQRHKSFQEQKFSKALDSVYEHRKNASLKNEDETTVGFHDPSAKRKLEYQKRHRSSQTLVQLADDLISQAIKRGEFDNLKGIGKPLKHSTQNPYVDTHTKYLNQFLINSGHTLDWISQEKEIREAYALMKKELIMLLKKHKGRLSDGNTLLIPFKERLKIINKMIDDYNLQVPVLSMQKFHCDFHKIYEQVLIEVV